MKSLIHSMLASYQTEAFQNVGMSFLIIFLLWIISRISLILIQRHVHDLKVLYACRKTVTYFLFSLGIILIFRIWFQGFQSFVTFFGLVSAGLAIALKDIVMDVFSWFYIILKRPFNIGERIQVGEICGDVIDIGVLKTTILEVGNWVDADQSTGRIITIPNAKVVTDQLANSHGGFPYVWHEIPVLITSESDWKKSKIALLDMLRNHLEFLKPAITRSMQKARRNHMIYFKNIDPTIYITTKDSGILLTLRFLCEPTQRRQFEHDFWEMILELVDKNNWIDLAYPTVRYIDS